MSTANSGKGALVPIGMDCSSLSLTVPRWVKIPIFLLAIQEIK